MTSVNLVSPDGNGHTYSVRFREPLVIEANSRVYLNFAKFKRNSSIYFTTDQTIEVVLKDVLPTVLPSDTLTSNLVMPVNSITIPTINPLTNRTGYTPKELEEVINIRFEGDASKVDDHGIRAVGGVPKQMILYNPVFNPHDDSQISVGWYKNYQTIDLPVWVGLSGDHNLGMDENALGDDCVKTTATNATDPYYDCYGMSKLTYDFSYTSELVNNSENHNLISFNSNMTVNEQVGSIFMGLGSFEIAEAIKSNTDDWTGYKTNAASVNSFTHGTTANETTESGTVVHNPVLYQNNTTNAVTTATTGSALSTAVLGCFLGVEITGAGAHIAAGDKKMLNIWKGVNYQGTKGLALALPSSEMNRMEKVWSTPVASLLGGADETLSSVHLAFQTYWGEGFQGRDSDKLDFRIYNLTQSNFIDKSNIVYDSANHTSWLTYGFFKQAIDASKNATQKAQQANSQIPFSPIFSAQINDEGFENIKVTGFEKRGVNSPLANASDASPATLVQTYQLKFSSEIARFVGVNTSSEFNPNQPEDEVDRVTKRDADQHTDESYSIFLKNLPIRAFKNSQSKKMSAGGNVQAAGYAQPIIADVPTPYSDSKMINTGAGDIVVGTFQPSIQKNLDLNNNKMVLNNIDVEIRDIESNEISEGLSGSVINFTIQK
tara:strand:- start:8171 stop:10153 length:1983 start_codon:yes stop_codon:yes gene_type:complete